MALSSTTAREPRNNEKRAIEAILETDAQFIQGLKLFSDVNSVSGQAGGTAQNSPSAPAGNYLAREGDTMIGPLALGPPVDFRIEVDANNTIDISPLNENAQYSSNVQLDSLQPFSSVLDIIAGAAFDGQILVIRTFAPTVPYTISQATGANGGNIQTPDGNDFTVGDLQTFELIFDASLIVFANTGGTWRVKSAIGGGGSVTQSTWTTPVRISQNGFNFFFPFIQEVADGVTLVPGDRVLQKDELIANNNGLFVVVGPLIPGVPNLYSLVRADFPSLGPIPSEVFVAVEEGSNTKKVFHLTTINPIIVQTDPQIWEEFAPNTIVDPIILNENDLGSIGFLNQLIDWSANNFFRAELNGDITVTMENLPAAGKWEQLILQFTQDAVGGHTVTFTDAFSNAVIPIINPGANSVTTVAFYAYNPGVDQILAFNVLSNFSEAGAEYGHFTKVANQPPPLTVGTPALFDSIIDANGLSIDLAGRVSGLRAGHVYECECFMAILNNVNAAACLSFQFFDVASALLIGSQGDAILATQLAADSAQPSAKAFFTASLDTDTLEVHFNFNNDLVNTFMYGMGIPGTPQSYMVVKDVTGLFGGSGTVINFPNVLINDVMTVSPLATLNIDLGVAQHWVVNLTQNLTVTFTNIPPDLDTSEQLVIEYVQDVVGGHTVTYTDTIAPIDPPISTLPTAREVVTGFVRRENAGTYVYNLYLVGN